MKKVTVSLIRLKLNALAFSLLAPSSKQEKQSTPRNTAKESKHCLVLEVLPAF